MERQLNKTISAADANRKFSELLRTVKQGRSVIVTSHGKSVARITPVAEDEAASEKARSTLFGRLRKQRAVDAGRWTREELYEDAT
jgi:prevent-host-death family protein